MRSVTYMRILMGNKYFDSNALTTRLGMITLTKSFIVGAVLMAIK